MALMEADLGITSMAMDGGNNSRYAADDQLLVKFYHHPTLNQAKSDDAGRPVYEEIVFIEIRIPGDKDSVVIRKATDMDIDRFPEHYRKFKARDTEDHIEGTLLDEWPGITRSQCEDLKFFNIRTVEQLASLNDSSAQNVMGAQILKSRAVAYLEDADANAAKQALAAQKQENEELRGLIAELSAKIDAQAEEPAPKKRGRPKKVAEE